MVNIATMLLNDFLALSKTNTSKLAVLIDPDRQQPEELQPLVDLSVSCGVGYFFIGGSLMTDVRFEETIEFLKEASSIPVVIFPGSNQQISSSAGGILLLSMISGRNPELLIGQHVLAAPRLKASGIECLPTGYILIDGGKPTTVSYISNTTPIPADKPDIAAVTAMAGEMLGLKLMYLDAGSGATNPVSPECISKVKASVNTPIIVGGGIRTYEQALAAKDAGATIVVVGNSLEEDPNKLLDISAAFRPVVTK
jgi:putative glycerol-1-phosphate prenyltransferase